MTPRTETSDPRVIKALTHPLRVQLLRALEDRTASPSELAEEIGAPLGNVSYHVRQLHSLGLIKLVKRTPRRGAIEHYYTALERPHTRLLTDELALDEQGLEEVAGELARTHQRLAKIAGDSARRIEEGDADRRQANVVLVLFEDAVS